jgi:hypothetical protein
MSHNWKSTNVALPYATADHEGYSTSDDVLVRLADGGQAIAYLHRDYGDDEGDLEHTWVTSGDEGAELEGDHLAVSHWQPLPSPPVENHISEARKDLNDRLELADMVLHEIQERSMSEWFRIGNSPLEKGLALEGMRQISKKAQSLGLLEN